jgi:hypothetical protein
MRACALTYCRCNQQDLSLDARWRETWAAVAAAQARVLVRWGWVLAPCCVAHRGRPAARSHRQKAEILARFKATNARSAPLFLVCVGMALVNNISARKFSRREIGGPAQDLRAGVGEPKWVNGGMILVSLSLLLASECLEVTTGTTHMCRQDGGGRFFSSTDPHSSHKARGCTSCRNGARRSLRTAIAACPRAV